VSGPAPAPAVRHELDGLAVVRRRRDDLPAGTPTVVLVHGAMDRAASFGRVMRRLGDLDVVAYDRRGYAGSLAAGAAPVGLDGHAADLAAVASWTGGSDVVVVGHSLGGSVALVLAAAGAAAGPMSTLGVFECPVPDLPHHRGDAGDAALAAAAVDGPSAASATFSTWMLGERAWQRMREADRAARLAEGPALVAELEDLRRPGAVRLPGAGAAVVRVGAGSASPEPLRLAAAALADRLGSPCDVLPGAAHGAHLSHPDLFAAWVRAVATGTASPDPG
jgi:pimeloyl-ACP methyl ester carboxylesterase